MATTTLTGFDFERRRSLPRFLSIDVQLLFSFYHILHCVFEATDNALSVVNVLKLK